MSGKLKLSQVQLGASADATKNFVLSTPTLEDGTLSLKTGAGSSVLEVSPAGVVTFPAGAVRVGPFAGALGTINLDNIPTWVRKITLVMDRLSTSGASLGVAVRLKSLGVTVTTGYDHVRFVAAAGAASASATDTAYLLNMTTLAAADVIRGVAVLHRVSGHVWQGVFDGVRVGSPVALIHGAGVIDMVTALDGVQILATSGALDSGTLSAIYEG